MADQIFDVKCGFFNSVNNDRVYYAEDMNEPYKRLINDGIFTNSYITPSNDFLVTSPETGMTISVNRGEGFFNGKWFENEEPITIAVPPNTGSLPRRDSVIIQINKTLRSGNIVYREGIPSSNPMPPDIGLNENIPEYRVANIYVAAGAMSINNDAIVDLRGTSECPWSSAIMPLDAQLASRISSLESAIGDLNIDSGWTNFTLESGATAYSTETTPAVRRVGKTIYFRGCVKSLTSTGVTIATLPSDYRPTRPHYFTQFVGGSGALSVAMLKVNTNGTIQLVSATGTITSASMIPIATQFIIG